MIFSAMVGSPLEDRESTQVLAEKTLKEGKYAVFTHRGTLENLYSTYRYIYGTWLPATKEKLDDREDFEVYEREVSSISDQSNIVKIFIPIK